MKENRKLNMLISMYYQKEDKEGGDVENVQMTERVDFSVKDNIRNYNYLTLGEDLIITDGRTEECFIYKLEKVEPMFVSKK